MELIRHITERGIYYCNVRVDKDWFNKLTFDNWIAFTIVDVEDKDLLNDMTAHCLDNGVCYTCSVGELASLTEDYFDEEIVSRAVDRELLTGIEEDYEATPMTTFHRNFDDGFWFASSEAKQIINDQYIESRQLVCIDCTRRKVRQYLINLIDKINDGWLPDEESIKKPLYDS